MPNPALKPRHSALIGLLTLLLLTGCSSSRENSAAEQGTVEGHVEQVFHHGAFNPDGPNKTITRLANVQVFVADGSGTIIDTLVTDAEGEFSRDLPAGTYVLSVPARQEEDVPGNSPSPWSLTIIKGDTVRTVFQFSIYAP